MFYTYPERDYSPTLIDDWKNNGDGHRGWRKQQREMIDRMLNAFDTFVLHEDDDLLILNKPPFIASHCGPGNPIGVEEITKHIRTPLCNLVHRLDKDTTGVLAVAKNEQASHFMREQFYYRKFFNLHKFYLAVVDGECTTEGDVELPLIIRNGHPTQVVTESVSTGIPDPDIKMSHTVVHPLQILENGGDIRTVVLVELGTGRKHQIRTVMAHLGHPITGDYEYNPDPSGAFRPMLHAWSLEYTHPTSGLPMKHQAPIPRDMRFFIRDIVLEQEL